MIIGREPIGYPYSPMKAESHRGMAHPVHGELILGYSMNWSPAAEQLFRIIVKNKRIKQPKYLLNILLIVRIFRY